MEKIEKLTEEQIARFPEYVQKWLDIGLSTAPADRKLAEQGIRAAYRAAKLDPPQFIIWLQSPYQLYFGKPAFEAMASSAGEKVMYQVREQVMYQVWDQVRYQVGDQVREQVGAEIYGQHESWLSYYDFMSSIGVDVSPLSGLMDIAKSAGWWIPYKNVAFVSERHNQVCRDERNRLHSLTGPALSYPDGWSVYAVHGVRVPARNLTHHRKE